MTKKRVVACCVSAVAAVTGIGLWQSPVASAAAAPSATYVSPGAYNGTTIGASVVANIQSSSNRQCNTGYWCAYIARSSGGFYKLAFPYCGVVNLDNWVDSSGYGSYENDNQTGGVVTHLYSGYGGSGSTLASYTRSGTGQTIHPVLSGRGYEPVNSIRVC
ncbi:hypothetical protein [Allobranchiibius huperziae]|uniref:Peptidase inhibitor family I36 n=1 Tax=Allobranchiibius huperziae TaxID=1874116 RepID=A0A853DIS0_9MICO|nr:hypothetical protein [Allobranchiibius huperziae]NYJ74085.1 hypothetical protein [Allobranchiibius huperziae]